MLYQKNKKAEFNYHILEKIEVGIILEGWEAKAIQAKSLNMDYAFITIKDGTMWLHNVNISPLTETSTHKTIDNTKNRQLLAHKKEINSLYGKIQEDGLTIVPLQIYRNNPKGKIKCLIGLAKGKKIHDKRKDLKEKAIKRENQQEFKQKIKIKY